ncbi:transposable element Tcb1 transposase [Trichonephila clavipes]|nr:transposable element Tcb1 transposase [Trichonephila clavipes]
MARRSHFQQDNVSPHKARILQDCLCSVTTLPWPARSPDLSPIEHIWDHLGPGVGHPTSLNELEARLQQIWNEMSQDIIQNLYASMTDRMASCIRARGGVQQGIKSSSKKSSIKDESFANYSESLKVSSTSSKACYLSESRDGR